MDDLPSVIGLARRDVRRRLLPGVLLAALAAPAPAWAASGTVTVLYEFVRRSGDPENPLASLVAGPDGAFYGNSDKGGEFIGGTVFKVTAAGTMTVLYSFGGTLVDGTHPVAPLIWGPDGFLYGTTTWGGPDGFGTVYKISPLGAYVKLYDFRRDGIDGRTPDGGLVRAGDFLYGTTLLGGHYQSENFSGTVYRISTLGEYKQLYAFGTAETDGQWPFAGLVQGTDGNLYGTTYFSGPRSTPVYRTGGGTFFRMTLDDPVNVKTLYEFNKGEPCDIDGAAPRARMILGNDGNFYGVTVSGGLHDRGTIFRVTPEGKETVLYSFGSIPNDGREPFSALVQLPDGSLVGTTRFGGPHESMYENLGGTIFMLEPDGTYTQLHVFGSTPTAGQDAWGGLALGADGHLYGTTAAGGASIDLADDFFGAGLVYRLVIDRAGTAPSFKSSPIDCTSLPPPRPNEGPGRGGGGAPLTLVLGLGMGLLARKRPRFIEGRRRIP